MIIFKEYHICEVSWKNWAYLRYFSKCFAIFHHLGGKISNVHKKYHISEKKKLASIVAPRDKSPRAFLQNIITKKRTRGFLSSVNWSGEKIFFPKFFFVSEQQKTRNPSPQSSTLLTIFSQIIILRKSSEAF